MTIKHILAEWTKSLHEKVYEQRDEYRENCLSLKKDIASAQEKLSEYALQIQSLTSTIQEQKKQLEGKTELELYCEYKFREVEKFAYKNKGLIGKTKFTMYPNELIQPEVFLIKKFRDSLLPKPESKKEWALKLGIATDEKFDWTSDLDTDGLIDVYQTIYQTMLRLKQDCEQHAAVIASLEPEFGMAWGFAGTTGHAFNVFIHNGELWCIESNSTYDRDKNARVFQYNLQSHYKIHWIFTKNRTYKCKTNASNFGEIIR